MINKILEIKETQHLNSFYFVHTVHWGPLVREIKPGQFFELKNPELTHPMLRKPISVYDVQSETVSFMIKRLGKGTEQLALLKAGDKLDLLGPLGNTFPLVKGDKAVLVSGGIGYPPLFFLKKQLIGSGKQVYWLQGGRSKDDIFPADEIWTDDGSAGKTGFVTDGLLDYLKGNQTDVIYACGPKPMLKACADIAAKHNIPIYVSLEEYMACGIGVCHGCAVKVKADNAIGVDYKTVCKDGPVFDAREVIWD
jgi:dihydroorotate dehydrogenase electron transfer subunit